MRNTVTVKYVWEETYQKLKKHAGWDEVADLKKKFLQR